MPKKKRADEGRSLYKLANNWTRKQWEFINQKGFDFAHDDTIDALAYACKFAYPCDFNQGKDGVWKKKKPIAKSWVTA